MLWASLQKHSDDVEPEQKRSKKTNRQKDEKNNMNHDATLMEAAVQLGPSLPHSLFGWMIFLPRAMWALHQHWLETICSYQRMSHVTPYPRKPIKVGGLSRWQSPKHPPRLDLTTASHSDFPLFAHCLLENDVWWLSHHTYTSISVIYLQLCVRMYVYIYIPCVYIELYRSYKRYSWYHTI